VHTYVCTDAEVAAYVRAYSQPGALRGASVTIAPPRLKTHPLAADAERQLATPVLYLWGARRARTAAAWERTCSRGGGRCSQGAREVPGRVRSFPAIRGADEVNRELLAFLSEEEQ